MILLKCAHKFFMRIFRIYAHLGVSIQRFFYAIIQNVHTNRWMETQLLTPFTRRVSHKHSLPKKLAVHRVLYPSMLTES